MPSQSTGSITSVIAHGDTMRARWQKLPPEATYTIFENSFGNGLHFLNIWHEWIGTRTTGAKPQRGVNLHYIAVEPQPLTTNQLRDALDASPELRSLSTQLINNYPPHSRRGSTHNIALTLPNNHEYPNGSDSEQNSITLTLIFDDVQTALCELTQRTENKHALAGATLCSTAPSIDRWFLHNVFIANNSDTWQHSVYAAIALNSSNEADVVINFQESNPQTNTQTNTPTIIRHLQNLGFRADIDSTNSNQNVIHLLRSAPRSQEDNDRYNLGKTYTPWLHIKQKASIKNKTVIIIGAGLAGAHTARALAVHGYRVTVVDKKGIAAGASSNLQGAVYTKLSSGNNDLTQFNLAAQLFADRYYAQNRLYQSCGEQSGVFHLAIDAKTEHNYRSVASEIEQHMGRQHNPWAQWLEPQDTITVTGLELNNGGIFLPNSGWLQPEKLCQALLEHPRIQVLEHTNITQISRDKTANEWQVFNGATPISSAEICIICNAADAKQFEQTQFLTLKNIRGQVSHIHSNPSLTKLKTVVCGKGYIAPPIVMADTQRHCIGATFNLNDDSTQLSPEDHQTNLSMLASISDHINATELDLLDSTPTTTQGNVGFRCTTPDYFPIVGPVPNETVFCNDFAPLGKNAKAEINVPAECHPNLYCNIGYGSRGLAYTPITATLLANIITGKHLPISESLYKHLHPARFLIRDIIRNKR